MKFIKGFNSFILESQSKKLKKYLSFSVVIKWYRENKHTIASILGVEPEELASEDDLLDQSHGLVNGVINTQTRGNRGTDFRVGFSKFDPIEQNLIHDILHNMYEVQKKTFTKNLDRVEFSESEIIEEIECLGLEESFMKYMNIKYPKTDFINQNINQLVSHLMLSVLFNDADRVAKILDGEKEPYLEIYGEEYPVKGTPFEGVYDLFKNTEADHNFKIGSSEDLKTYLIHLLNIGEGIDETNGDRAEYPDGSYYGSKDFDDLDSEDAATVHNDYIEENGYFKVHDTYTVESLIDSGFYHELRAYLDVVWDEDHDNFDDFNYGAIGVDTEEEAIEYFSQFEEEEGDVDYVKYLEEQGLSKWDIKEYYGEDVIVFIDGEPADSDTYNDGFYSHFYEGDYYDIREYDYDHEFINKDYWENKDIQDIVNAVIRNDNARSILRRNFRTNDIVKNNTKLGKNDTSNRKNSWGRIGGEKIDKGTKGYTYFDFFGEYDYTSLSKNLFSNNAKKLTTVLNTLRGYVIKNVDQIKATHKANKKKFTKEDISYFQYLSLDVNKLNRYKESISDIYNTKFRIQHKTNSVLENLGNLYRTVSIVDKISSEEDIDYLFNWVNKSKINNKTTFHEFVNTAKEWLNEFNELNLDSSIIDFLKSDELGKDALGFVDKESLLNCKTESDLKTLLERNINEYYSSISDKIIVNEIIVSEFWCRQFLDMVETNSERAIKEGKYILDYYSIQFKR